MKTYLEYQDSKSHKFWQIERADDTHTVTYGRVGTAGQSKTKTFASAEAAQKDAEKLIKSKTKKGYVAQDKEVTAKTPAENKTTDGGGDHLAQFLELIKKQDAAFIWDWAGCRLLGHGADDIATTGETPIADNDMVFYDERGRSGVYVFAPKDASIRKVILAKPEQYDIDPNATRIPHAVTTDTLVNRYGWIVNYITRQDYCAPFENPQNPFWQSMKYIHDSYAAEKAGLADDPHLALYWMFHFMLISEPNFQKFADCVTELGLDREDDRFKMLAAFAKAKAGERKQVHYRAGREAVLLSDCYSRDHAGGAEALEYWWRSLTLSPKNNARILCRLFWCGENLVRFDEWTEFATLVVKRKRGKPIALFAYLEALRPDNPKAGTSADQAATELENELEELRGVEREIAAGYCYYGLLMLWRLKEIVQDKDHYQQIATRYYKNLRDEDAPTLTPAFLEIMASLGEDPDHPDLEFAKELLLMPLPRSEEHMKEEGEWLWIEDDIREHACTFFARDMHRTHIFDYILGLITDHDNIQRPHLFKEILDTLLQQPYEAHEHNPIQNMSKAQISRMQYAICDIHFHLSRLGRKYRLGERNIRDIKQETDHCLFRGAKGYAKDWLKEVFQNEEFLIKYTGSFDNKAAEKVTERVEEYLIFYGETAFVNEKKGITAPDDRPEGIPPEAIWNERDKKWELGESNDEGRIGEWKWWTLPNYNLRCHTFYGAPNDKISATRFHPNGEVSLELAYDGEGNELTTYYKSTEDTNEHFPDSNLKNVWSAKRVPGSFPRKYEYFDREGNTLSASRKDEKALKKLKEGPDGETALEAMERFEKVMKILENSEDIDEDFEDFIDGISYCIPKFSASLTEEELVACEEKFNVTLPLSYRNFVLKHGLIDLDESGMLEPVQFEVLSEHLKGNWGIDVSRDFPPRSKQKTDLMLVFYTGPYDDTECFDFNT